MSIGLNENAEGRDVYVDTLQDADGQGLRIILHFPSPSVLTPEFAKVAIKNAVNDMSAEIVRQFKDEILKQVNFEELAHLVLTKSAERVAEKISSAVGSSFGQRVDPR